MRKLFKKTVPYLFCCLISFSLFGQDEEQIYGGIQFDRPQLDVKIWGHGNFNLNDVMGGFGVGFMDYVNLWGMSLGWDFRIGRRPVLKRETSNLYYQFLEKRKYLYLKTSKMVFFITSDPKNYGVGIHADFRGGLYYGNYTGTDEKPMTYWLWSPSGGFAMNIDNLYYLKLGYQYLNVQTTSIVSHWISLSFQIRLKT